MAIEEDNLDDILRAYANTSGWDFFSGVDPRIKKLLDIRLEEKDADFLAIAKVWAEFAATPGGKKALQHLFDSTLFRVSYIVQLGLSADQVGVAGAAREGQNMVADEIRRMIAVGRGVKNPKRRRT